MHVRTKSALRHPSFAKPNRFEIVWGNYKSGAERIEYNEISRNTFLELLLAQH